MIKSKGEVKKQKGNLPKDNCLIVICVHEKTEIKEKASNYASLKNHLKTIKEHCKDFVLVFISETKITLRDVNHCPIEPLN